MKNKTITSLLSILAFVTLLAAPGVMAQSTAFTYQGRLADTGSPANGFFDLTFSVWDAVAGPAQVGGTLTNTAVEVTDGLFTVTLDFGSGVFTGPDRWLEIGVTTNGGGAFTTLAPRTEITATPYALHARTADDAATATTATTATTVVGGIDDADADPLNELNLSVGLSGTLLELKDAGAVLSVDLAPLVSDNDWDYFSGSGLSGEIYHSGDVALGTFTDPDGYGLNAQTYTGGKGAVRGAEHNGSNLYAEGQLGVYNPDVSPMNFPLSLVNAGVVGIKHGIGGNGVAVAGWNNDDNSVNYGAAFIADGTNTGQNIAIYGEALNGADNIAALLKGDVIVENDYLEVKGNANERAYIGGDGAGNDVQIGSLRSNVVNVATWNPATGSRMHFIASNITAVGNFIGNGSQLTGIGASALGPDSVGTSEIINDDVFAVDLANDNGSLSKVTAGTMTDTGTRIGIGTPTPADSLHLFDAGNEGDLMIENSYPFITLKQTASGNNAGILFDDTSGHTGWLSYRGSDQAITMGSTTSSGSPNTLVLQRDGNAGIGTSSAFTKLTVNGTIGFPNSTEPMMYMHQSGTVNPVKPIAVHSPSFPTWGLFYDDSVDQLMIGSTSTNDPAMAVDLFGDYVMINTRTRASGYELSVDGQIACEELLVLDSGSWPDYVFAEDYNLMPLKEVEAHIKANKRLPGIPAAEIVAEEGISVGAMQKRMMEKIEELTLYTLEQEKRIAELESRLASQ